MNSLHLSDTASFLAALDTATTAIGGKVTLPVLSCVMVRCGKESTVIHADNLNQRVEVSLPDVQADNPFTFVASPRMLKASLRADAASIMYDGKKLHIDSGGKSSFSVAQDPFPESWKAITVKPVESARFLAALKLTIGCADLTDEVRNSSVWEPTNGHILSIGGSSSCCVHPFKLGIGEKFSIPQSACRVVASIFDADDSFALGFADGILHIQERNVKAWFKTMDVKVPNVAPLIIQGPAFATFPREGILRAIESLEPFASPLSGDWCIMSKDGAEWSVKAMNNEGESNVPLSDVEHISDVEPFQISRGQVSRFLRGITADRVEVRNTPRAIMFTACDETKAMAIMAQKGASA